METENQGFSLIHIFEKNIKAIISISAITYAWGIIVVSAYLSQYHIVPSSILRIQYVMAGIWVFIPILVFVISFILFATNVSDEYSKANIRQRGKSKLIAVIWIFIYSIMPPLGWIFGIGALIWWIAPGIIADFHLISGLDMLKIGIYCLGIGILVGASWLFFSQVRDESGKTSVINFLWGVTFASMALAVILSYSLFFATEIYPKIPAVMGGGQPIAVKLVFVSNDNYGTLQRILNYGDTQELPPTLSLITTTDEHYIVLDPNDTKRTILIPKSNVFISILESE